MHSDWIAIVSLGLCTKRILASLDIKTEQIPWVRNLHVTTSTINSATLQVSINATTTHTTVFICVNCMNTINTLLGMFTHCTDLSQAE